MNNNTPIVLRIKFKKVGNLQYVSHLDLVRTMHKIIVRSKLPLWYTEGFNPKPKMVFAAPLSIGTESLVEFMDLRLVERIDPALAIKALNANMTDELVVLDAYYPETKLTDLKWLSYVITLNTIGASPELADKVSGFEIYATEAGTESYKFGNSLLPFLAESTNLRNRGMKISNDLRILKNATMPAILIEMGFISNPSDATLMAESPELFASGIYNGILSYFDFAPPTAE